MKAKSIKFFSPLDNQQAESPKKARKKLTGKISNAGRLGLTANIIEELGIDADGKFHVGGDGKRTIKTIYLVPAEDGGFSLSRVGRGLSLELPVILKKGGINYDESAFVYTVEPFLHEGETAFAFSIEPEAKVPYTGKPRGRKPKVSA